MSSLPFLQARPIIPDQLAIYSVSPRGGSQVLLQLDGRVPTGIMDELDILSQDVRLVSIDCLEIGARHPPDQGHHAPCITTPLDSHSGIDQQCVRVHSVV